MRPFLGCSSAIVQTAQWASSRRCCKLIRRVGRRYPLCHSAGLVLDDCFDGFVSGKEGCAMGRYKASISFTGLNQAGSIVWNKEIDW